MMVSEFLKSILFVQAIVKDTWKSGESHCFPMCQI